MKSRICILSLVLISFFIQDGFSNSNKSNSNNSTNSAKQKTYQRKNICWTGTINGKIPILLHYQFDNEVIIGEIIYLNTKGKLPIKVVGTIQDWDKKYRLLEFDRTGNITGIIVGLPEKNEFKGIWTSPKTKKELNLNLSAKDTIIFSKDYRPDFSNISGEYYYQYGETGYNGYFRLTKMNNNKASFEILSVTSEPDRNIAQIDADTINLTKTEFSYKVPGNDECEFKVKFFKDFVFINYTKGYCLKQFGFNATIDGIFFKVK